MDRFIIFIFIMHARKKSRKGHEKDGADCKCKGGILKVACKKIPINGGSGGSLFSPTQTRKNITNPSTNNNQKETKKEVDIPLV